MALSAWQRYVAPFREGVWRSGRLVQVTSIASSEHGLASDAKTVVHRGPVCGVQMNIRPRAEDDELDVGAISVDHELADIPPSDLIKPAAQCLANCVRKNIHQL